ncbi:hypothetical protein JW935_19565 [candidate division KSB1 bacterium]|nr:hypothetical protein [candidate division KSB1 bacterium]
MIIDKLLDIRRGFMTRIVPPPDIQNVPKPEEYGFNSYKNIFMRTSKTFAFIQIDLLSQLVIQRVKTIIPKCLINEAVFRLFNRFIKIPNQR